MCEALVEIMQPYIDEQVAIRTALGVKKEKQKIAEQIQKIKEQEQKIKEREQKIADLTVITDLTRILLAAGRIGDLSRAMDDEEYRNHLCKEFALL